MNLNKLRDEAYRIAHEHGFHSPDPGIPGRVALIHSEVSEVLEAHREGMEPGHLFYEDGKPEGIPAEIADIMIRCLDFCGAYSIDIEEAVIRKMAYNESRPFKHGKAY